MATTQHGSCDKYNSLREGSNSMIYLTGDKHRGFSSVASFCNWMGTTKDDILVILGDAVINYAGDALDREVKEKLEQLPITLLCVHGNHERRPYTIDTYKEVPFHGGVVYQEPEFPSLLFAKDGEVYDFDGKKALILGGAYSVDKYYRLQRGMGWFADEQPSDEIKARVRQVLSDIDFTVDYVFSHTCPERVIPKEKFLPHIDQSTVDRSTEEWLGGIEDGLKYSRWYCGHWHTDKTVENIRFMFNDVIELGQ